MSDYSVHAEKIVEAAQAIKSAIEEHGFGTAAIMIILSRLMAMTEVANFIMNLPEDQRDEFFGEVWDEAIGTEPNALVNKVGIFEGETLEQISDAIKVAFVAYMNREMRPA
jgi:hypothetical protein